MINLLPLVILAVVIFLFIFFISCIRIVPQAHVYVIEHLGAFLSDHKCKAIYLRR